MPNKPKCRGYINVLLYSNGFNLSDDFVIRVIKHSGNTLWGPESNIQAFVVQLRILNQKTATIHRCLD